MPSKKPESLLTIFYKNPELGKVKTRLAASIGEAKAYSIHLLLCEHTIGITEKLSVPKAIYYSDFIDQKRQLVEQQVSKIYPNWVRYRREDGKCFSIGFQ